MSYGQYFLHSLTDMGALLGTILGTILDYKTGVSTGEGPLRRRMSTVAHIGNILGCDSLIPD